MKQLITPAEVSARTVLQLNAAQKKIEVAIPLAQLRRLRPLLGDELFDELLVFVQKEASDVADPLAALQQQSLDMLAGWSIVEAWPTLIAHITEAGIVIKNGKDVSSSADAQTVKELLDQQIGAAQLHSSELVRWIVKKRADYPSYRPFAQLAAQAMPVGGLDTD